MSRSTQYIGLTRAAQDYVKDYQEVESTTHTTGMFEEGMFEEQVWLREWIYREENKDRQRFAHLIEIVQEISWSSGPMIFTCLHGFFQNDRDLKNPVMFYEWVHDPTMTSEFDEESGRFWV